MAKTRAGGGETDDPQRSVGRKGERGPEQDDLEAHDALEWRGVYEGPYPFGRFEPRLTRAEILKELRAMESDWVAGDRRALLRRINWLTWGMERTDAKARAEALPILRLLETLEDPKQIRAFFKYFVGGGYSYFDHPEEDEGPLSPLTEGNILPQVADRLRRLGWEPDLSRLLLDLLKKDMAPGAKPGAEQGAAVEADPGRLTGAIIPPPPEPEFSPEQERFMERLEDLNAVASEVRAGQADAQALNGPMAGLIQAHRELGGSISDGGALLTVAETSKPTEQTTTPSERLKLSPEEIDERIDRVESQMKGHQGLLREELRELLIDLEGQGKGTYEGNKKDVDRIMGLAERADCDLVFTGKIGRKERHWENQVVNINCETVNSASMTLRTADSAKTYMGSDTVWPMLTIYPKSATRSISRKARPQNPEPSGNPS